jgi:hypothetical protein
MLMNAILPVAERMLARHREFYPYGGYMRHDGTIAHLGAADPDTDRPKSENLLYVVRSSLREIADRKQCEAAALVFNVSIALPSSCQRTDAIQLCIEHEGGYAVEVFVPYRLTDDEVFYGETFVQKGSNADGLRLQKKW